LALFYLTKSQKAVIVTLIVPKLFHVPFGGHLSPAIILATTTNITNILISVGGSYQKLIECGVNYKTNWVKINITALGW
jgi:hypothetical protein